MANKINFKILEFVEIKKYLKGLPEDIWDILIPSDENKYKAFIAEIKYCSANEETRTHIMKVQRKYNLPLRPNDSIVNTMIKVRIKSLRDRNRKYKNWD